MTSSLCQQVIDTVKKLFPEIMIIQEEFVYYKNQKLFLDIFLPQLGIVIEVHGRQHDNFVAHFHGDDRGFRLAKKRDFLKSEWADFNNYTFITLRENDLPVTPDSLLERIDNALSH